MAIGTVKLIPVEQPQKNVDITPLVEAPVVENKEPVLDYTPNSGVDNISIAVIAQSRVEAKDFICGMYLNLLDFSRGSNLSVYIRDHGTLSMVTETKQYFEELLSNPKDTDIECNEDMQPSGNYEIVLGESGNQKLTLNVKITCASYEAASSTSSSDAVFIILNSSDASQNKETVAGIGSAVSGRAVDWVITGFENDNIYYCSDLDVPPSETVTSGLTERFGVPYKSGDRLYFAQQYGALSIKETNNGLPVYTTLSVCREYTPTACCLPLIYSVMDIYKLRSDKSDVLSTIYKMIRNNVYSNGLVTELWRKEYSGTEA